MYSMYRQQIYVLILRERAPQKHIFSGLKYICIHIQSMQFPLITSGIWRYKRHYTDKTLTLRKIYEYASERSEQKNFTFSHSKTAISFNILLVLQILCVRNTFIQCTDNKYMYLYCASERLRKHIFLGLKYICIHTINAVSFNYLWYMAL